MANSQLTNMGIQNQIREFKIKKHDRKINKHERQLDSNIEFTKTYPKELNILCMDQKLTKLINYFRNYSYTSESSPTIDSQQTITVFLDQCISNAQTIIDLYQQKINLLEVQNQSLHQDMQHLKISIAEDKLEAQNNLDKQKSLTNELRKELMQKDFENRILTEKIEQLQMLQADQLVSIKNQQNQQAQMYEDKIYKQTLHYQEVFNKINYQLQTERKQNFLLQAKINELSQQLQSTIEQNTNLRAFIQQTKKYQQAHPQVLSSHKKYLHQSSENLYPIDSLPQAIIPHLQIINDPQQPYLINTSQDQILNQSFDEHPTALQDVLNFSGCNSRRFNMREFLRSKEKQNIDLNSQMNGTNSPKKIYMSSQKRKLQMYSNSKQNLSNYAKNEKNLHQTHFDQHKINQFTIINHFQQNLDPYFVFFVLTAQCIKINSKYFEEIAQINIVDKEWDYVIRERIPMNLWAKHLQRALLKKVGK